MADERSRVITRRELLQSAGAVGAAAAAGVTGVEGAVAAAGSAAKAEPATQARTTASSTQETYEHLTAPWPTRMMPTGLAWPPSTGIVGRHGADRFSPCQTEIGSLR